MMLLALLSGCEDIKIENTELCSVAGRMKAGADCVNTLNQNERSMTLDELITFLEPQQEKKDPKTGKILVKERGAAIIQSAEDFNKTKTALEKACYLLKKACSYDIQQAIKTISANSSNLLEKSKTKKFGPASK